MPHHVVVDGSNLATEGRPMPSLLQLLDAVQAYRDEEPDSLITVVVDATFGHRIDSTELPEFEAMVNNNELVCPPAGAIGRGDAFVLSIAHKVGATILSNDSFQEFHGTHTWLFEEGRLIGGKPVPHIGWVFVARSPVRGPTSRKAVSEAKRKGDRAPRGAAVGKASVAANQPMPVPATPPPGARLPKPRRGAVSDAAPAEAATAPAEMPAAGRSASSRGRGRRGAGATEAMAAAVPPQVVATDARPTPKTTGVNDLLTFLTFVQNHPVGTSVNAIVEHYSSHGAYVAVGEAKGYVPLRLMSNPAPRSAREFMKVGESVTLVVESIAPARRSIDLATPLMATVKEPPVKPAKSTRAKKVAPAPASIEESTAAVAAAPTKGRGGSQRSGSSGRSQAAVAAARPNATAPSPTDQPSRSQPKRPRAAKVDPAVVVALTESAVAPAKRTTKKASTARGPAPTVAVPAPAASRAAAKPTTTARPTPVAASGKPGKPGLPGKPASSVEQAPNPAVTVKAVARPAKRQPAADPAASAATPPATPPSVDAASAKQPAKTAKPASPRRRGVAGS